MYFRVSMHAVLGSGSPVGSHLPVQRIQQFAHALSLVHPSENARHTQGAQHRQELRGGACPVFGLQEHVLCCVWVLSIDC